MSLNFAIVNFPSFASETILLCAFAQRATGKNFILADPLHSRRARMRPMAHWRAVRDFSSIFADASYDRSQRSGRTDTFTILAGAIFSS
jgi:hypothetical protein